MLILLAQNNLPIINSATVISPVQTIGKLVELGSGLVLVVGTLAVLLYLIMGGFNWLTAGGDKSKVELARTMITQAIIGLAILASVFAIFGYLLGFFGIRDRISLGFGGTVNGGNPPGGNPPAQTCAGNIPVNGTGSTGTSNSYCNTSAATMKCVDANAVAGYNYIHLEPCSCAAGTADKSWNWQVCP